MFNKKIAIQNQINHKMLWAILYQWCIVCWTTIIYGFHLQGEIHIHNPCILKRISKSKYLGYMEDYKAIKDQVITMDLPIYQKIKKKEEG